MTGDGATPDPLAATALRLRGQRDEILSLVEGLDDDTFSRVPAEGRWSVGEHLAHLCNTNGPYVTAMEAAVERARRKGWRPDGSPPGRTWFGRKFEAHLRPPPRRRTRTFGAMKPPPAEGVDRSATVDAFGAWQDRLLAILAQGDEVDLARARIASPFAPFLFFIRFPVFEAVAIVAAHNDRHRWLMEEALEELRKGDA